MPQILIEQDAIISKGSFKVSIVKVYSIPSKYRVDNVLNFFRFTERVAILELKKIFIL